MSFIRPIQRSTGVRYQAHWVDPNGKQRCQVFGLRRDAQRHLDEIGADTLTGKYADPRAGKITVRAYGDKWALAQPWEPSTRSRITGTLRKHVYAAFGDRAIGSVRTTEIQGWITTVGKTVSPDTAHNIYRALSGLFKAATFDRVIGVDPCADVTSPDKERKDITIPTPAEVAALVDAAPDRYRAAVLLAAGCGTRQSEMTGLALDKIVFPTGTAILGVQRAAMSEVALERQLVTVARYPLYWKTPKSRAGSRTIPLPRLVTDALVDHVRAFPPSTTRMLPWQRPDGESIPAALLFTTARGCALTRSIWSDAWTAITKRAGLPGVRYHDLRHYAVSSLIRHGASIKEVQYFAGHATSGVTLDIYGHMWPDSEERTRLALNAAMDSLTLQRLSEGDRAAEG